MTDKEAQRQLALVATQSSPQAVSTEGFDPSRFKPSLAFLRKVEARQVKRVRGYTRRRGGYDRLVGGEKQWLKHFRAGYVSRAPLALLGQPGVVELTDKGRAAIAMEACRGETPKSGSTADGGDSAGAKHIARKVDHD